MQSLTRSNPQPSLTKGHYSKVISLKVPGVVEPHSWIVCMATQHVRVVPVNLHEISIKAILHYAFGLRLGKVCDQKC